MPCFATRSGSTCIQMMRRSSRQPKDDRDDTPRSSWWIHWSLPEPRQKWIEENDQAINLVPYLASTSFIDSQIGRILDALEETGHTDDTIVVLSDHGYHLGEKLITGKNTLWRIDAGTADLCRARSHSRSGVQSPAELLDIYPTWSIWRTAGGRSLGRFGAYRANLPMPTFCASVRLSRRTIRATTPS